MDERVFECKFQCKGKKTYSSTSAKITTFFFFRFCWCFISIGWHLSCFSVYLYYYLSSFHMVTSMCTSSLLSRSVCLSVRVRTRCVLVRIRCFTLQFRFAQLQLNATNALEFYTHVPCTIRCFFLACIASAKIDSEIATDCIFASAEWVAICHRSVSNGIDKHSWLQFIHKIDRNMHRGSMNSCMENHVC